MMDFDIKNYKMNHDDDTINMLYSNKNNKEMISYQELESNNDIYDNRISYSSFIVICTELFNSIKDNH